jgi:tetratricopeptide (TPR) repeat protein
MSSKAYILASFLVLLIGLMSVTYAQNPQGEPTDLNQLKEEYKKLKNEYEMLAADRNNILLQSKKSILYKSKARELEDAIKKALKDKEEVSSELASRITQNQLLQEKLEQVQDKEDQLTQEKENLKNYIEKMEIEYRIVNETKGKISELTKKNTELLHKINGFEDKISNLEKARLDALAEAEVYRRQLRETNKKFDEALVKNKVLEKKAEEVPRRFAELARENKVLIKQTALMHYNLGVFYVENKEFHRAIAELEKAIELNPDDAYAHFNLGYIYAEYIVDRPKAIAHFRQFLRLAKVDDKDVDWVKKYIITWQTWEGKKPIN